MPHSRAVYAYWSAGALVVGLVMYRKYVALKAALRDANERRNRLALSLMATRNSRMHTKESVDYGRAFKPRASDVFIATYPKCGTTWVSQIVHALRSHASMDFGEITEVCPWDILALDCGQDLNAEQVASPRIFKTHEGRGDVAKGARYIYVARDPADAFVSFHKFLPSVTGLRPGDLDEEAFASAIFAGTSHSGQIWDHFLGWWQVRHRADILWIFFEDLAKDLRGEIERIARFMRLPVDDQLLDAAVRVSSFDFMAAKENRHHYDDHFVRSFVEPMMGLGADTPKEVTKVRASGGKVGSKRSIPPAVRARLDDKWAAILATPTGCKSYRELYERVRAERDAPNVD